MGNKPVIGIDSHIELRPPQQNGPTMISTACRPMRARTASPSGPGSSILFGISLRCEARASEVFMAWSTTR